MRLSTRLTERHENAVGVTLPPVVALPTRRTTNDVHQEAPYAKNHLDSYTSRYPFNSHTVFGAAPSSCGKPGGRQPAARHGCSIRGSAVATDRPGIGRRLSA